MGILSGLALDPAKRNQSHLFPRDASWKSVRHAQSPTDSEFPTCAQVAEVLKMRLRRELGAALYGWRVHGMPSQPTRATSAIHANAAGAKTGPEGSK